MIKKIDNNCQYIEEGHYEIDDEATWVCLGT